MKKKISSLLLIGILALSLVACSKDASTDTSKIKIGVSPEPHSKIVKLVQEDLKKEGIELEIVEFTDYIIPNKALDAGDIDLNFFQHKPFMDSFVEENGLDLTSLGGIHIEPMALYSEKFTDIKDIKGTIGIPNDPVNGGRALILLENEGIIKLKEGAGLEATELDIVENPYNLEFKALEAANLPRVLGELDGAVINGNYALFSDLNPLKDGIIIEDKDSPYANIVAVRTSDKDDPNIKKVYEALTSNKVKDFILSTYDGAIVPAF